MVSKLGKQEIDSDEVRRIAKILRLKLSKIEQSLFTSQINMLLRNIARLEEVNTKQIPPTNYRQDISYPEEED